MRVKPDSKPDDTLQLICDLQADWPTDSWVGQSKNLAKAGPPARFASAALEEYLSGLEGDPYATRRGDPRRVPLDTEMARLLDSL
jgi:hypothetical protein